MTHQNRSKRSSLSNFSRLFKEWQNQLPEEVKTKLSREKVIERIYEQFAQVNNEFILEHVNAVYLLNPLSENPEVQQEKSNKEAAQDIQKQKNPKSSSFEKRLIVYVDNSLVAAELNARKELICFKYLTEFNIKLIKCEINISKGHYRSKYPYKELQAKKSNLITVKNSPQLNKEIVSRETLSSEENEYIDKLTESIEDARLKKSFEQAMAATFNKKRKLSE